MGHYVNRQTRLVRNALLIAAAACIVACGPRTPEDLMAAAREELRASNPRAAEIHLKKLLSEDPDNPGARFLLGEVLLATGDAAGSEFAFRRAAELGTPWSNIRLPLLSALIAQGKFDEVLMMVEQETTDLPRDDQVAMLTLAAMAHRGLGSVDEAEEIYKEALSLDPTSAGVRSEYAGFLLDIGRRDKAGQIVSTVLAENSEFPPALYLRGLLERAANRHSNAEATFKKVISSDSTDRRTRLAARARLVETQLTLGKIAEASAGADRLLATSPNDPVLHFLKARVEFAQGDLDAAARRLQELIADFPGYEPPYKLMGNIKLAQGRLAQATAFLRTAIRNDPSDHSARLLLAEALISDGDLESARALFEETDAPGATEGLFLASAGWLSLDKGQTDTAADFFNRSEATAPASAEELVGVSSIYLAAGEFERAIRVLRDTALDNSNDIEVRDYLLALIQLRVGDLPAARQAAARLVDARPDSVWSLNLLGTVDLLSNDLASARKTYARVLKLQPDDVPARLNLARVAVASNDNDQAVQLLKEVLEIEPDEPTASIGLAQLAAQSGNLDEALSWLSQGKESSLLLQLQAEILTTQKRFGEAAGAFSRAFEMRPSSTLALKTYAVATRAGLPEPESTIRKWVADHPNDVQGNFVLGLLAQASGADEAAIGHYEAILAVQPTNTAALNNLAGLYSRRGDERALELATRAYRLQPDDPSIADTLGWLLVTNNNADAAIPLLERAAAGLPDNPEVRYHLAVARAEGTGDPDAGLRDLRELLDSGLSFPSRAHAESYLAERESRR